MARIWVNQIKGGEIHEETIGGIDIKRGYGSGYAVRMRGIWFWFRRTEGLAIDPTYGMYQVCADVNDVEYRKVLLDEDFQFSADKLLAAADEHTKLIFICSPNNPTGNDLLRSEIETLIRRFDGLVILDEAYNDFSEAPSFLENLNQYPNLIVLQTFSKAWGCAAIRLGCRSHQCLIAS